MPTPQEKKSLLFLSLLTLLGVGVRAARAIRAAPPPDPGAEAALRNQIAAVDSARARSGGRRQRGSERPSGGRSARSGSGGAGGKGSAPGGARARVQMSSIPDSRFPIPGRIDLDRADAAEIERLPYVGPVLARRIVADRDSAGPFGSLEALERVRGVGPALARKLAPNVTFSLPPRQSRVEEGGKPPSPARRRRARRPRPP